MMRVSAIRQKVLLSLYFNRSELLNEVADLIFFILSQLSRNTPDGNSIHFPLTAFPDEHIASSGQTSMHR